MNTNKLLRSQGFQDRANFPDMAKYAATLAKEGMSESEILDAVRSRYDAKSKLSLQKPGSYWVLGEPNVDIQSNVFDQMNTVMSIPPAVKGALMPDAHLGYGMPIGGVVALENAVSPNFVGFDIACRMMLTVLDIHPDDLMARREEFADILQGVTAFGVGASFRKGRRRDHPVMEDDRWNDLEIDKEKAWSQLGSSGGGNHFADLMVGEWLGRHEGIVFSALMTHSGSRGSGHATARKYGKFAKAETDAIATKIPKGYEWLDMTTDVGREYWQAMNLMGDYAQANHELIHHHFMKTAGLQSLLRYDNHHNFAWKEGDWYIHRKGATPAAMGEFGIIPGSSGSYSYLVTGLGHEDSLQSSSHGAGRNFSRSEAKAKHDVDKFKAHMAEWDVLHRGVANDETPFAYKDIERVIDLQTEVLIQPAARMKPVAVIMGGGSRQRRK